MKDFLELKSIKTSLEDTSVQKNLHVGLSQKQAEECNIAMYNSIMSFLGFANVATSYRDINVAYLKYLVDLHVNARLNEGYSNVTVQSQILASNHLLSNQFSATASAANTSNTSNSSNNKTGPIQEKNSAGDSFTLESGPGSNMLFQLCDYLKFNSLNEYTGLNFVFLVMKSVAEIIVGLDPEQIRHDCPIHKYFPIPSHRIKTVATTKLHPKYVLKSYRDLLAYFTDDYEENHEQLAINLSFWIVSLASIVRNQFPDLQYFVFNSVSLSLKFGRFTFLYLKNTEQYDQKERQSWNNFRAVVFAISGLSIHGRCTSNIAIIKSVLSQMSKYALKYLKSNPVANSDLNFETYPVAKLILTNLSEFPNVASLTWNELKNTVDALLQCQDSPLHVWINNLAVLFWSLASLFPELIRHQGFLKYDLDTKKFIY